MDELRLDGSGRPILPQPAEVPKKDREDAMGAYLMMFGSWFIGLPLPIFSFIAALVYHLINRKRSRFVAFHSMQSFLTESLISLVNTVAIVWLILCMVDDFTFPVPFWVYIAVVGIWNLIYIIFSLIAAVKAYKGQFYYFLVFGRMSFDMYYGKKAFNTAAEEAEVKNLPPAGFGD